jgi:hypothetical protein
VTSCFGSFEGSGASLAPGVWFGHELASAATSPGLRLAKGGELTLVANQPGARPL